MRDGPVISNISLINKAFSDLGKVLHYKMIVDYLRVNWAYGAGLTEKEARRLLDIALGAKFYYEAVDEQHFQRKHAHVDNLDQLYQQLDRSKTPLKQRKRNPLYKLIDLNKDSRFIVMVTEENDTFVLLSKWNLLNDLAFRLFINNQLKNISYFDATNLIRSHYEIQDQQAFFFPHFDNRFIVTSAGNISLKDYDKSQIKSVTREVTSFVKEEVARHLPLLISYLKENDGQEIKIRSLILKFLKIEPHIHQFGAYFQAIIDLLQENSHIRISSNNDSLIYFSDEEPNIVDFPKISGITNTELIENKIKDFSNMEESSVVATAVDRSKPVTYKQRSSLSYTLRYYDRVQQTLTAHYFKDWIKNNELYIELSYEPIKHNILVLYDEEQNILYGTQLENLMSDYALIPGQRLHFKLIKDNRISLEIGDANVNDITEQERYKDIARLAEENRLTEKSLLQIITELLIYHPSGLHISELTRLVKQDAPYAVGSINSTLSKHDFFSKVPGQLGFWQFNPAKWKKSNINSWKETKITKKEKKKIQDKEIKFPFISTRKLMKQMADHAKKFPGRMTNESFNRLDKETFMLQAWNNYANNIYNTAKRFSSSEIPLEDYFQEAYFALDRAYDNYDPSLQGSFYNYFRIYLSSIFQRYETDNKNLIRIPNHRTEELRKLEKEFDEQLLLNSTSNFELETNNYIIWKTNYISYEELYIFENNYQNIDNDQVRARISSYFSSATHYSPEIFKEQNTALYDNLPDSETTAFKSLLYFDQYSFHDQTFINKLWEIVDKKARSIKPSEVLKYRFGFKNNREHTLEEIGDIFGVTRERVRQIQKRALDTLANYFKENKFKLNDFICM